MPDIDSLMQEWPGELEELLNDLRLPNAALDLDLSNYAGLICGNFFNPLTPRRTLVSSFTEISILF